MAELMNEKMMRIYEAGGMRLGHSTGNMKNMKRVSFEVALAGKQQIATGTMAFSFEKPQDFNFNEITTSTDSSRMRRGNKMEHVHKHTNYAKKVPALWLRINERGQTT